MPTVTNLDELLANINPYLKSARPLDAMKRAGFTFSGSFEKAIGSRQPAEALAPTVAERLEKELAAAPPIRLRIGAPPKPPVERDVVGGFRAAGSIDLDSVNAVIAELWRVGTVPNALSVSDTTGIINLATLSQLCINVPTAADASLGGLEIITAPILSASTVSTGNVHMVADIKLPVLGSQPSFFQAALNVEIPLGLRTFVDTQGRYRLSLTLDETGTGGAQATLTVDFVSEIWPASTSALNELAGHFTQGIQQVLAYFCFLDDVLSLPAEATTQVFPNTHFKLTQAGAVTVQNAQKSFLVLGVNIDNGGQQVDPSRLTTVATPAAPYEIHGEIDESFASDALAAVISSGDLAAYVNHLASQHWWGSLLPQMSVSGGSVSFQDGNVSVSINVVVPHICIGLDLGVTATISGPPVISNGAITIDAQYVDMSVNTTDAIYCLLVAGAITPLLALVFSIIFGEASVDQVIPGETVPASYSFAPLPGSDKDWTLAVDRASANNGTLTLDGSAAVAADPRYLIYLRIVTQLPSKEYLPVQQAQVTLMELDNPAPAGDDVVIPQTGTSVRVTQKFVISNATSYVPSADQTLGSEKTDQDGNVMFIVDPAQMNHIGGIVKHVQTETDTQTAKTLSSDTWSSDVPERLPDFGVGVVDSDGKVLLTRHLVALNSGTRVGTYQNPAPVVVSEPVVAHP